MHDIKHSRSLYTETLKGLFIAADTKSGAKIIETDKGYIIYRSMNRQEVKKILQNNYLSKRITQLSDLTVQPENLQSQNTLRCSEPIKQSSLQEGDNVLCLIKLFKRGVDRGLWSFWSLQFCVIQKHIFHNGHSSTALMLQG